MKPFTPINETSEPHGAERINLSTSLDRQTLYLDAGDVAVIFLNRPTAEWLHEQLGKALKQPKTEV